MIPTLLLFGLLFGRWWKTALLVGTLGSVLYVLLDPRLRGSGEDLLLVGAFAFGNTAVGVAAHQILRLVWLGVRPQSTRRG